MANLRKRKAQLKTIGCFTQWYTDSRWDSTCKHNKQRKAGVCLHSSFRLPCSLLRLAPREHIAARWGNHLLTPTPPSLVPIFQSAMAWSLLGTLIGLRWYHRPSKRRHHTNSILGWTRTGSPRWYWSAWLQTTPYHQTLLILGESPHYHSSTCNLLFMLPFLDPLRPWKLMFLCTTFRKLPTIDAFSLSNKELAQHKQLIYTLTMRPWGRSNEHSYYISPGH